MISAQSFMLANLVVWVGLLVALAIVERRQRDVFRSRNGVRYRRLTTKSALKRIGETRLAKREPAIHEGGRTGPDGSRTQ